MLDVIITNVAPKQLRVPTAALKKERQEREHRVHVVYQSNRGGTGVQVLGIPEALGKGPASHVVLTVLYF